MAARELFRDKGYAGASMQDLAQRIGLKKASLYMRFANKEALVPEVMELLLRETLSDADIDDAGADWYAAYSALVRSLAGTLSERKRCVGLHLAYGMGDETPIARQAVCAFFLSLRARMTAILAEKMPRGRAETLAADALVRLEGATLMIAVFNDVTPMERAVEAVLGEAREAAQAQWARDIKRF